VTKIDNLTEGQIQDIQAHLETGPYKLPKLLAQETEILLGSAITATIIITFRRYKITVSMSSCEQIMQQGFSHAACFYKIFTAESWNSSCYSFQYAKYVKKERRKSSCHSTNAIVEIVAWYELSTWRIIDLIFFRKQLIQMGK
jgi:hypothetical protein